MNELYQTISIGIISGVITTILVFFFSVLVKKSLIPFWERLRYKDFDIEGSWSTHKELGDAKYSYLLELKQNAHDIKGTATIIKEFNGTLEYNQGFIVTGYIWGGYVTLNLRSNNRRSLSFATALLKVMGRGNPLEGFLAYRRNDGDGVGSEEIAFQRKN